MHLSQILGELELTNSQKNKAVKLIKNNLEKSDDWIVINLSLQSLAKFTSENILSNKDFIKILSQYSQSEHKSVRARVNKLKKKFES